MAGLKSTGGLTGGRGFDESTRLLFLLSRPICADVCHSIFDISGRCDLDETGHRDLKASRIRRDMSDIHKLVQVLIERGVSNQSSQNLGSPSTGLVAGDSVNADNAKAIGDAILTSMIGNSVAEYKFFQKNQVKTLASAIYVKTATDERIEMDPGHIY